MTQREFDAAREKYRRAYNRGYSLSEQGYSERAQAILDRANREYDAAKAAWEVAQRAVDRHTTRRA